MLFKLPGRLYISKTFWLKINGYDFYRLPDVFVHYFFRNLIEIHTTLLLPPSFTFWVKKVFISKKEWVDSAFLSL